MRDRIVELTAWTETGEARAWRDLYLTAQVEHTQGKRPGKGKAELYNLSEESIAFLERCVGVSVLAGEEVPSLLFRGDLSARDVRTRLDGVDRITSLEAGDGREAYRSGRFSRSYPEGTQRSEVLADLVSIAGLSVGYTAELEPLAYESGLVLSGRLRDALDELLGDSYQWAIQDGQLEIHAAGEAGPARAVVIAPDSGLIGSPERTDKGVGFSCTLLPELRPRRLLMLESALVSGWYRATKVSHDCDSRGITWQSSVEAVPVDGGGA